MATERYYLDLDALIEGDQSSYEYYVGLSPQQKSRLDDSIIHTLEDLQAAVAALDEEKEVNP